MKSNSKYLLFFTLVAILFACDSKESETKKMSKKARVFFLQEDYTKSLVELDKLLAIDSTDHKVWLLKGTCLYNLGQEKEGIAAASKCIEYKPTYYKGYMHRASMYGASNIYAKSMADVKIALEHYPNNLKLVRVKAGNHYGLEQYEEAISDYDYLLSKEPENYMIWCFRGASNLKLNNFEAGLEDFEKAIEIDSLHHLAYYERSGYYVSINEMEKALSDCDKSIAHLEVEDKTGLKARTYSNRGFVKYKMNDLDGAKKDIEHSMKLDPNNSYTYKNLALVQIAMDNTQEACANLANALVRGYRENWDDEVDELMQANCGEEQTITQ